MSEDPIAPGNPGAPEPCEKCKVDRRDFLNEISFGALAVAGLGSGVVSYQYMSPNVLFEPPTKFRAGSPDLYPVDSVTYLQDQLVYIMRSAAGFWAVSAVCTHLGCITAWHPETNLIQCPCHGSKFKQDGVKVAGPAPRPLPHFSVTLSPDGELVVDKLETVQPSQVLKV
jgi:cytochrome b6-f complex iron-sulfur subunit